MPTLAERLQAARQQVQGAPLSDRLAAARQQLQGGEIPEQLRQFRGTPTNVAGQPVSGPIPRNVPAQPQEQERPSFVQVAGRSMAESGLQNLAGFGNFLLNKATPDVVPQMQALLQGQPVTRQPQDVFNVQGTDIMGQVGRIGELGGAIRTGDFGQFTQDPAAAQQQALQREAQQRPGAALAGQVAGDAATIAATRTPVAGAGRQLGSRVTGGVTSMLNRPAGVTRLLGESAQKAINSKIPRGLGKVSDLGLQGALLASLEDQDPVKAGGIAAGSQAFGSLALTLAKPLVTSKKGLLTSVALGAVGLEIFDQLTPGGDKTFDEQLETSVFKILPLVAAGVAAGGAGFGRLPESIQKNMPKLTDTITSLQTGAVTGLIQELSEAEKEGNEDPRLVLEQFRNDPEFFGQTAMRRIERTLQNSPDNFNQTVEDLMKNRQFREKVEELKF